MRKDLLTEERNSIVQFLLQHLKNGKPANGKINEAASMFNTCRHTIGRIWKATMEQQNKGQVIHLQSKKKGAPHQKRVVINLPLIESLSVQKRGTIRKLANGISCSKSTVHRWSQDGLIKAHSSAIKPSLTAQHKLQRLQFSIEALQFDTIMQRMKFRNMQNTVHIDEKWLYLSKAAHRFYLTPNEVEPHRSCQSKKFISKVMFMCAVARPLFAEDGTILFDGKIGIFPFTEKVPAMRASKNRPKGTVETKAIQSITKQVINDCLIKQNLILDRFCIESDSCKNLPNMQILVNNTQDATSKLILPAIRSKWPPMLDKLIFIQHDNARPHIKDTDIDFRAAATEEGFDIRLVHQPPNSPDTNVNDLGWFRAIQSIQIESDCKNVDQLVNAVCCSFAELAPMTLNKVFLSLQGCMVEIMKVKGNNSYKIPHMRKEALLRQNELPIDLEVSLDLVRECFLHMMENGMTEEVEYMRNRLGV